MRSDIDTIMQARDVDALLVVGPGQHNPAMVYLTGGAHLTDAYLVKKRGAPPVLFHRSMERDEAARTGLETRALEAYRFDKLLKQADGDTSKATVARFKGMFDDLGLTKGHLAISGASDAGTAYKIFSALQEALPDLTLVGELDDTTLLAAMATKDMDEVERIRQMGEVTTAVVALTADFLVSHRVQDDTLVKKDRHPLTIGEVKSRINRWLVERGAENPKGTILATGYDSAVPHSSGTTSDHLRLGQTIIFDIFPCEAGGGYYYDLTRTWCLGYAPDEALALYEDVKSVYQQVMAGLKPGRPFKEYQRLTCELFEARGHPTIKEDPTIQEGYVHSVGHGLGLYIHQHPFSSLSLAADDLLKPGAVVTIEPGLYYPDRSMGVRLEDTVWFRPDGKIEILAEYPHDLVLPMRG